MALPEPVEVEDGTEKISFDDMVVVQRAVNALIQEVAAVIADMTVVEQKFALAQIVIKRTNGTYTIPAGMETNPKLFLGATLPTGVTLNIGDEYVRIATL